MFYKNKVLFVDILPRRTYLPSQNALDLSSNTNQSIPPSSQQFHNKILQITHRIFKDQSFNPPTSTQRLPHWMTQAFTQGEPNLINDPIGISSDTSLLLPDTLSLASTPSTISQIPTTTFPLNFPTNLDDRYREIFSSNIPFQIFSSNVFFQKHIFKFTLQQNSLASKLHHFIKHNIRKFLSNTKSFHMKTGKLIINQAQPYQSRNDENSYSPVTILKISGNPGGKLIKVHRIKAVHVYKNYHS